MVPRAHTDFCRRDISLIPAGIRNPSHPARSLVRIPTTFIPTHSVNLKCSIRFNVLIRFAVGPHQRTSLQLLRTESTNLYPQSLYNIASEIFLFFFFLLFFLSVRPNTKISTVGSYHPAHQFVVITHCLYITSIIDFVSQIKGRNYGLKFNTGIEGEARDRFTPYLLHGAESFLRS